MGNRCRLTAASAHVAHTCRATGYGSPSRRCGPTAGTRRVTDTRPIVIDISDRIRRKPEPYFSRVDDELLGLDTHTGFAYSLNASAGRIWELIEDWTTAGAVCAQLEREYDVEPAACASQVAKLLSRLEEVGLLDVDAARVR